MLVATLLALVVPLEGLASPILQEVGDDYVLEYQAARRSSLRVVTAPYGRIEILDGVATVARGAGRLNYRWTPGLTLKVALIRHGRVIWEKHVLARPGLKATLRIWPGTRRTRVSVERPETVS